MEYKPELKMNEKPDDLLCFEHHNKPTVVLMDNNLQKLERLACPDCQKTRQNIQPQAYEQIQAIIREEKQKRSEEADYLLKECIKQAEEIKNKIEGVREKIMEKLDQMNSATENLILTLKKEGYKNLEYNFFDELENYVNKVDLSEIENAKLKNIRLSVINWFGKLEKRLSQIPQSLDKILENSLIGTRNFYKKTYNELHKPLEFNLIQNFNQRDPCYTLAFSKMDNLLFTGCGKHIKVWNFDQGKIKELTKLNGHIFSVTSIVTSSKVKNSFVSVAECGSLIIWKQKNENEWESQKKQTKWSNSMLLNKDETQLILATVNSQIDIWDIDFNRNSLKFKYSLQDYHTNTIFDISLNKKETRMVSCGADNKILIWKKDIQDPEWTMIQEINQPTYGTKVAFLSDEIFVWIGCEEKTQDQLFFFELQKMVLFKLIYQKPSNLKEMRNRLIFIQLQSSTIKQRMCIF